MMNWAAKIRQNFIADTLQRTGKINRADICSAFGISTPQASLDLKKFQKENPDFAEYNTKTKQYEYLGELGKTSDELTLEVMWGRLGCADSHFDSYSACVEIERLKALQETYKVVFNALKDLRNAVRESGKLEGKEFDGLGVSVNRAIALGEAALGSGGAR